VYAQPLLTAEWNYNRFFFASAENDSARESLYGQDTALFPIRSIAEGRRPGKGICKARIGEARISWDYFDDPRGPVSFGDGARYYIASVEDTYKYWSSPAPSQSIGGWPSHEDSTVLGAKPKVEYERQVRCNKIVIGIENTWASPTEYDIWIRRAGTWTKIADESDTNIDSEGRIILWFNSTGWSGTRTDAWYIGDRPHQSEGSPVQDSDDDDSHHGVKLDDDDQTGVGYDSNSVNYGPFQWIDGIRFEAHEMSKSDAYLNVIEISARLERNLTPYLISVSDTFDMGESDQVHPIGRASSNTAEVQLDNGCMVFNNDNSSTQFKGLLDANVRFNLEYVFDTYDGSSKVHVQQFEMYSETWNGQGDQTVNVQLRDASKFLQETKSRPMMYEKYTVAEIVWQILDSVGFDKYEIHKRDDDPTTTIDIFWTDRDKTVWEVFLDLCESHQVAIYFDGYGVLQVKTARAAFDESRSPDWQIYGDDPSGSKLPDLVTLEKVAQYEANHVTVSYQQTQWKGTDKHIPASEIVWEPSVDEEDESEKLDRYGDPVYHQLERRNDDTIIIPSDDNTESSGTVVLRATPLTKTLEKTDDYVHIDPREARHWPFRGILNIQGELIEYSGKEYRWYTGPGNEHVNLILSSKEDKRNANYNSPVNQKHRNGYTGRLWVNKRGLWNSENKRHVVEAEGWNVRSLRNGDRKTNAKGFRHMKKHSQVRMHTLKKWNARDMLIATRGEQDDAQYYGYGARMCINKKSAKNASAGIVLFNRGNNEAGYYVSFKPTNSLKRADRNEMLFYARNDTGGVKVFGKGEQMAIREGGWFDVDVVFELSGTDHKVTVIVNGLVFATYTISGADKVPPGGKFGMFVKGHAQVDFEYMYAIKRNEGIRPDNSQFFDRVHGGYQSAQWDREWVWNTRMKKEDRITKFDNDKDKERFAGRFMDEFGPIVHEVREFHAVFDPFPVQFADLYLSNDWQVFVPEYRSDAFEAHFVLTNATRQNAVVNGEDSLTFAGSGDSVNQRLAVLGRTVVQKEAQRVIARNDDMIDRRGKIDIEIASQWIQSKGDALRLAEWIIDHWAGSTDVLNVEIFGNPLIELGDVVEVQSKYHDMSPSSHKYYVTGTTSSFDSGLSTSLTLRRVRPAPGP